MSSDKVSLGRPARLSREQVLSEAMQLLADSGGESFSLRKLASRLGTVPANLYTYFPNKNALFDALAEQVLASLDLALNPAQPWEAQLKGWMNGLRDLAKSQPALPLLIGLAGTSASAVRKIEAVARLLEAEGMGFETAVLHAQGLLWSVMSFTLFEIHAGHPDAVKRLQSAGIRTGESAVMAHLALQDLQPLWETTLERSLAGLRVMLAAT